MELDEEQRLYLREGIAAREQYYGGADVLSSEASNLTLALAWFRAYWRDRLTKKDVARR